MGAVSSSETKEKQTNGSNSEEDNSVSAVDRDVSHGRESEVGSDLIVNEMNERPQIEASANADANIQQIKAPKKFCFNTFMVFISPLMLILFSFIISLMFQNSSGLCYLGSLIISLFIRFILIYLINNNTTKRNTVKPPAQTASPQAIGGGFSGGGLFTTKCDSSTPSLNNNGFGPFVYFYTIMYIFLPIWINGDNNIGLLLLISLFALLDIYINFKTKCTSWILIIVNAVFGALLGSASSMTVRAAFGINSTYYNMIASKTEVCAVATKKSYQCTVQSKTT